MNKCVKCYCATITTVHKLEEFIMQLFTTFLATFTLVSLVGCSNSNIKLQEVEYLVISNEKKSIEVHAPAAKTQRVNLSRIYVDQTILSSSDDQCIVYEDISLTQAYQFTYAYKRSIDLIFNAYNVTETQKFGNLTFYRVTLRNDDRETINLMALTASKKSLKLLYGFDDEALQTLTTSLENNITKLNYTLDENRGDDKGCIKSQWNQKLLILDNIIMRIGGKIGH